MALLLQFEPEFTEDENTDRLNYSEENDEFYFRMTINITSVPYDPSLAERSSEQFQELSSDLILSIEALYSSTPGQQHITILRYEPGSVIATIDLGSLGYYDEEELKNVISRAIQRGFIGNYRVSDKEFTFKSLGESPEPIPSPLPGICRKDQFQCLTGECIEPYKHCDKSYDCVDGSDEQNCPATSSTSTSSGRVALGCRGDDQVLCSDGTCIDQIRVCDGVTDCSTGEDESDCERDACATFALCLLQKSCQLGILPTAIETLRMERYAEVISSCATDLVVLDTIRNVMAGVTASTKLMNLTVQLPPVSYSKLIY
ncbi:Basement membrane-specific heparan sulfate proteoglycan core protein [Nymphon striatum]|nr:Basement membrane-specific heparan sulfate proteoglycan core protein [Nymphon striatum]